MWFYDMEVFMYDWLGVFRNTKGERHVVVNDKEHLSKVLEMIGTDLLCGYNNYYYDDTILGAILTDRNPYKISKQLIEERKKELSWQLRITSPMTIDSRQELPPNLGLKEIEGNMGKSIVESKVPFDIDRPLTQDEIEDTIFYCDYDVQQVIELMEHPNRQDYFGAKVGLIKEFNLPVSDLRKTRARIMSTAMHCDRKIKLPDDRLDFDYAPTLDVENVDKGVYNFYEGVRQDFLGGGDAEKLEKSSYIAFLAGVQHKYAFGGLHGALTNFHSNKLMVHADFRSFYPAQQIEFNWHSRRAKKPEVLTQTFHKRIKYKAEGNPQQQPLKIGINAVFGILKDQYNDAFDPKMSNNICINGQLIISELVKLLEPFGKLVQTNTDGVIFELYDEGMLEDFKQACIDFGEIHGILLENDYVERISQRDVNNYIMRFTNGKIDAKGIFKRWNVDNLPMNIESNSFSVVDIALKRYYMDDIPIEDTILELYDNNDMLAFQLITKMGHTYDHMAHMVNGEFVKMSQNVNRVFATRDKTNGIVVKVKKSKIPSGYTIDGKYTYKKDANGEYLYADSYTRISNCPEHTVIHNEDISTFDKTKLDLQFYVDLVKNAMF